MPLHKRIKDLSVEARADKVAYLAKALEAISGQSSVSDIESMTDDKLKELLESTVANLADLNTRKINALNAISESEKQSLNKISDQEITSLSILDIRKNSNIAAINNASDLGKIKNNLDKINDLPSSSSIMKEIKNRNMVESESLHFLFGVLSRNNYYTWGSGHFTTKLGKWHLNISHTNNMFSLIVGVIIIA